MNSKLSIFIWQPFWERTCFIDNSEKLSLFPKISYYHIEMEQKSHMFSIKIWEKHPPLKLSHFSVKLGQLVTRKKEREQTLSAFVSPLSDTRLAVHTFLSMKDDMIQARSGHTSGQHPENGDNPLTLSLSLARLSSFSKVLLFCSVLNWKWEREREQERDRMIIGNSVVSSGEIFEVFPEMKAGWEDSFERGSFLNYLVNGVKNTY